MKTIQLSWAYEKGKFNLGCPNAEKQEKTTIDTLVHIV